MDGEEGLDYVGLSTTEHGVILEEMDAKHSSGQSDCVLSGSWVFLGHVHLPVFLSGRSVCLIAHGRFNLGCCSVFLLVLRGSIRESSRSAFPGFYLGIFILFSVSFQ